MRNLRCWLPCLLFLMVLGQVAGQEFTCPDGWILFGNGLSQACFYLSPGESPALEAQAFCRRNIGYLVEMETMTSYTHFVNAEEAEYDVINYLFQFHPARQFWSDMRVQQGRLVSETFGTKYVTRNGIVPWDWDAGQPALDAGPCGAFRLDVQNQTRDDGTTFEVVGGRVLASLQNCSTRLHYVCQRPAVAAQVKTTSFCPDGWLGNVHVPHCFRIFTQSENFAGAMRGCAENGGRLAPGASQFDQQLIEAVYTFYSNTDAFFQGRQFPLWVGRVPIAGQCLNFLVIQQQATFQNSSCNTQHSYMCIQDTVFAALESVDVISPYKSQAELKRYVPFQPELPVAFRLDRFPTEAEFVLIRTPSGVINMTDFSRFRFFNYPQFISLPNEVPFYFNITLPVQITPQRKRREADQISGQRYDLSRDEATDVVGRVKRQNELPPEGSGGEIFPPDRFVDYRSMIDYIGVYSGQLYSANPPASVESEPLLVRFSESDLFIYVAFVKVRQEAAEQNGFTSEGSASFGLLQDDSYPGILREAGTGNMQSPSIQFYEARVEQIAALTVKYRVFVAPQYSETSPTPARLEQEVLREVSAFRQNLASSDQFFFDPSSVVVRSTVACSPWTVTDPVTGRNVTFRLTRAGQTGFTAERCASGSGAVAGAPCRGGYLEGASWGPAVFRDNCSAGDIGQLPLSDSSADLKNLSEVYVTPNNSYSVLNETKTLTVPGTVDLTSVDVIYTSVILDNYRDLEEVVPGLVELSTDVVNNILQTGTGVVETAQDLSGSANDIIRALDDIANQITFPAPDDFAVVRTSVAVVITDQYGIEASFSIGIKLEGPYSTQISADNVATVTSPDDVIRETVINKIDAAIYLPAELLNGSRSRLSMQIYADTRLFITSGGRYLVNSKVIAARLTRDGAPVRDLGRSRVTTIFLPRQAQENLVCGYWNYSGNENAGDWATDGCEKTINGDHVICSCDHLTNFAILIDLQGHTISDINKKILGIITTVGLSISIAALGFTLLTFIIFRHLRSGRGQQVLVNLSLAMLCTAIVFLVGVERTENRAGCKAVAAMLHYFILASFMWMLIEGVLQYMRFVKVLGTYIPRFLLKAAIPAWGVPIIPVIIVLAIDTDLYYGGNGYCWLGYDAMLYAFLIPVAVIILINIIIFIMIVFKLCCGRKSLQVNQSQRKMRLLHFQAAVSVFFVLGLTWVFGFLAIEGAQIVFHYLFAILNAFQGFFIFILFTAREKKIRQAWRKLCCGRKYKEKTSSSGTGNDGYAKKGGHSNSNTGSSNSTGQTGTSGNSRNFHDFSSEESNGQAERQPMNFRNPEYDNNTHSS